MSSWEIITIGTTLIICGSALIIAGIWFVKTAGKDIDSTLGGH